MGTKKSYPLALRPNGLVDAYDATEKFNGACLQLANLIFSPGNPEFMRPRPGTSSLSTFAGFTTPGVVSVQVTVGSLTYGMISSGLNAGSDQPFCWNNVSQTFVTISGITAGNSPTTQPTTGIWTPPTMAAVGHYIIVTHPGFNGTTTKFGWIDVTNPAAPVWNAGDTATNALLSTPVSVANYNNRAYFACGNNLYYSDVANPLTRTNATQAVTLGDQSILTALVGLPIQTSSAGIAGALIAFKQSQIWQITGDVLTNNLATNYMSLNVGTNSPRSIAQTPNGIYFCSTAGPYFINQLGVIMQLSNRPGESPDILDPFQNCTQETRMAGGYVTGIYRVCLDTIIRGIASRNDYWFDENRRRWTGPHTFTYDCASNLGNNWILVSNANPANLVLSQSANVQNSVYTDLGAAYTCTLETSHFPKTQNSNMNMNQVVESEIELAAAGAGINYSVSALDESDVVMNSVTVAVPVGAVWGSNIWGGGQIWGATLKKPQTYSLPWSQPLVFKKMKVIVSAPANTSLVAGSFSARYQQTGYLLPSAGI